MIDSHCHPYSSDFDEDRAAMIERAKKSGISRIYMPAIDSSTHQKMIDLETQYPDYCIAMMGLHPCDVKQETYKNELAIVKNWLDKRPFAAIGEIGLDFYWDKSTEEMQRYAFDIQMQWALEKDLPIVIHARDSTMACVEMVKPFAARGLKGIFHCFGGSAEEANAIIDLGFLLGIGGVFTFKKANMPMNLKDISIDHIVLETDAPYLAPVPFRGKRNESSYIPYILNALSEAKGIPIEEIASRTAKNTLDFFKI
ncbi:TatD family deoxyribonuclease [Rhizosphaericola mali]|uniref:TatD family deoxyribonuclease n=1 Tax=Rhizosphaericola mali TaxID=2545455 RepID=A0A5P2GGV1_9BACT|nr:TatD family deoxyribonuclease [Rhizosphaericola mali]